MHLVSKKDLLQWQALPGTSSALPWLEISRHLVATVHEGGHGVLAGIVIDFNVTCCRALWHTMFPNLWIVRGVGRCFLLLLFFGGGGWGAPVHMAAVAKMPPM